MRRGILWRIEFMWQLVSKWTRHRIRSMNFIERFSFYLSRVKVLRVHIVSHKILTNESHWVLRKVVGWQLFKYSVTHNFFCVLSRQSLWSYRFYWYEVVMILRNVRLFVITKRFVNTSWVYYVDRSSLYVKAFRIFWAL